jgi:hypothetical protein
VTAAVVLSWSILSWTFLVVGHPESTPVPPLSPVQIAALLPGIVGLKLVEVLRPLVGQSAAFVITNLLVTTVASFIGFLGGKAVAPHRRLVRAIRR